MYTALHRVFEWWHGLEVSPDGRHLVVAEHTHRRHQVAEGLAVGAFAKADGIGETSPEFVPEGEVSVIFREFETKVPAVWVGFQFRFQVFGTADERLDFRQFPGFQFDGKQDLQGGELSVQGLKRALCPAGLGKFVAALREGFALRQLALLDEHVCDVERSQALPTSAEPLIVR